MIWASALPLLTCLALNAPAEESPREAARRLYEAGEASYSTHDFDAAIQAFTRAYELAGEMQDEDARHTRTRPPAF